MRGRLARVALLCALLFLVHCACAEIFFGFKGDHFWHENPSVVWDPPSFSLHRDGNDGDLIARLGGRGRARSDGITITRATRSSGSNEPVVVFTPSVLDVGWAHSCEPSKYFVWAESHSALPLRIQDVRIESDAFVLESDPRGSILAFSQSVKITLLFVVGEPQPFESFIFLVTTLGEFALPVRGHTQPNLYGLEGLRATIPTGAQIEHTISLHNPFDTVLRVSEVFSLDGIGNIFLPTNPNSTATRIPSVIEDEGNVRSSIVTAWEVPPFSTKPIARFTFDAQGVTGDYRSAIHISTSIRNFLIPIHLDVRKDQLVVEPSEVDIGVFTSENEKRDLSLMFHNTGSTPVTIRDFRLAHADGLSIAQVQDDIPVIQPHSQVQYHIQLALQNKQEHTSGPFDFQLEIKTNATANEETHTVQVRGFAMRGHISYGLGKTTYRMVTPGIDEAARSEEGVVDIGSMTTHVLVLKNEFDVAVELESASVVSSCSVVDVKDVGVGVTPPLSEFPPIVLQMHPNSMSSTITRTCLLEVQTNASVHQLPIILYPGLLHISSSRTLSDLTLPCASSGTVVLQTEGVDTWTETCNGPVRPLRQGSKLCRKVIVELGKVARFATLEDVVNITNTDPIGLYTFAQINRHFPEMMEVNTTISIRESMNVQREVVVLRAAWEPNNITASSSTWESSLSPGQLMALRLRIMIQTRRCEVFLERIATIETEFETIKLFIRFETTAGTISPSARFVEISSTHPGQLRSIDIPFVSTLGHDVMVRELQLSRTDGLQVLGPIGELQIPQVIRANSTTHIALVYFSPAFIASCRQGRFLPECFFLGESPRSASAHELSEFGSFVTKHDLERLEARESEWKQQNSTSGGKLGSRVDMIAMLTTDALHTAPIHLSAYLVRPHLFHSDDSIQSVSFPLTEILHQVSAYVTVINPSDYSMNFELAISEDDRELFYECDDDMNEDECLREWQDIARERVEFSKQEKVATGNNEEIMPDAPPLFFKRRIISVRRGERAQVGPIYFFPSSIGTWQTQVYLRNDLTHIEAVTITGTSGLGELTIDAPLQHLPDKKIAKFASPKNEIRFEIERTHGYTKSTDFRSRRTLVLSNTGSFSIMISVHLTDVVSKAFDMTADSGIIMRDINGNQYLDDVVLSPNESLEVSVEFTSDCFHSSLASRLKIMTREGSTLYHLIGTTSATVAFQCRRHLSVDRLTVWRQIWIVATASVATAIMVALCSLVRGMKIHQSPSKPQPTTATSTCQKFYASDHGAIVTDVKDTKNVQVDMLKRSLCALEETLQSLEETLTTDKPPEIATATHVEALLSIRGKSKRRSSVDIPRDSTNNGVETLHGPPTKQLDTPSDTISVGITYNSGLETAAKSCKLEDQVHTTDRVDCEMVWVESPETTEITNGKMLNPIEQLPREDTASEDEEGEIESADTHVDAETDGTNFSTPDEDDDSGRPQDAELLGLNFDDPFVSLSDFRFDSLRQGHVDESVRTINVDDNWNTLPFESLHTEIGKLVMDDFAKPDSPPSMLSAVEMINDPPVGDVLASLSMDPPRLPMSSLFALSGDIPSPPLRPRSTSAPRSAPPGFTAADADPTAREAFEQLRHRQPPESLQSVTMSLSPLRGFVPQQANTAPEMVFSARYSLFGPSVNASPARDDSVGRIGSRLESNVTSNARHRPLRTMTSSATSRLSALGGVEIPSPKRK